MNTKFLDQSTSKSSLNGNHKESVVLTVRVQVGELLSFWEPLETVGGTIAKVPAGRGVVVGFEVAQIANGGVEAVGDHGVAAPSANLISH